MESLAALRRYRIYLEALDREAASADEEEYFDLLSPGEVIDLLCLRDEIQEGGLTLAQQAEVARLDDLLVRHSRLVTGSITPRPEKARTRWWWHLHEGPQVREQALAAA